MKLNENGHKEEVRRLEWWDDLTPGEKKLICNLMRMLRGAKHSQIQEVARAAAKWERGIGCFIKVRLLAEGHQRHRRLSISVKSVTSSPSISRSQPSVSPNRD